MTKGLLAKCARHQQPAQARTPKTKMAGVTAAVALERSERPCRPQH
ncbi:MAG: hypothetical protein L5657_02710 [Calditerricola sp.]|nr:hypothetical protein [Calditerricola sp.]